MLMGKVSAMADFYKERHSDSGWIGTNYRACTQILKTLLLCLLIDLTHALKLGLLFLFACFDMWVSVRARFLVP